MPVPRPETPVEIGRPVALVNVPEEGVPRAPLNRTGAPAEPVLTASAVAIPVPSPVTPVEMGSPVALVNVSDDGVPPAPLRTTNAPAEPVLTPSAVATPVPNREVRTSPLAEAKFAADGSTKAFVVDSTRTAIGSA